MISLSRLARMALPDSGTDDATVLAAYEAFRPSQNADTAFQGLLGAVCAIARHRPHLLEQILPAAIDPGVSMGVETLDDFWRYADYCVRRALETPRPYVPDFTEETAAYLREELRSQEPLIERIILECLTGRREELLPET